MSTDFYIDLVLDNGEIIRVTGPIKREDAVREDINNAMRRRDWWLAYGFDGVRAEFMGMSIQRVNMGRVVAML
jgi:hypothetical protein